MKLLFCTECSDVFNLVLGKEKSCSCGKTKGKYIDNLNAEYLGEGIPIGFRNGEFIKSMIEQHKYGEGNDFAAFAIRKDCETFKKKD
jgi:hypothetical protein